MSEKYIGDFAEDAVVRFKFNTSDTFAGSPTFAVYKGNSVTEITAGITETINFDSFMARLAHAQQVAPHKPQLWMIGDAFDMVHLFCRCHHSILCTHLAQWIMCSLLLAEPSPYVVIATLCRCLMLYLSATTAPTALAFAYRTTTT